VTADSVRISAELCGEEVVGYSDSDDGVSQVCVTRGEQNAPARSTACATIRIPSWFLNYFNNGRSVMRRQVCERYDLLVTNVSTGTPGPVISTHRSRLRGDSGRAEKIY